MSAIHFYIIFRLPSNRDDEAMFHLDLCLEYMEIVDKQIVDEIPKIFIMMLVHKVKQNFNSILKVVF